MNLLFQSETYFEKILTADRLQRRRQSRIHWLLRPGVPGQSDRRGSLGNQEDRL